MAPSVPLKFCRFETFYGQESGEGRGAREYHIYLKKLLSHSAEKILEVAVWCFGSFRYVEIFCLRGYVTIFCQEFFASQYRKPRKGALLCFKKILVSKNFMDKRGGGEGGVIKIFFQKLLYRCQKNS